MRQARSKSARDPVLVIGYGNTLRRDDGVGPRVAEVLAGLRLPGVFTLACQQLSPEHAEAISRAHRVLFVDAAVMPPARIQWRALEASDTPQLMAHAANPQIMLALARDVFGHEPQAWMLTIPVVELGFGENLSSLATKGLSEAVDRICQWVGG